MVTFDMYLRWIYSNGVPVKIRQAIEKKLFNPYPNIFDEKKFIFVHIPKTAGKSILKSIGLSRACHLMLSEYESILEEKIDQYYIFSVVRHPVSRIVSAYKYFSSGGNFSKEDILIKKKYIDTSVDFNDFIERYLTGGLINCNKMFYKQSDYLRSDRIKASDINILKFENLSQDYFAVAKKINIKAALPHLNKSKPMSIHIATDIKILIEDVYHDDYVIFGYEFESQ